MTRRSVMDNNDVKYYQDSAKAYEVETGTICKRKQFDQTFVCDWYDVPLHKAKEKYRGVFEIQRSGDKTSSGEIGLDIRTHASPKVGQDQVSGGVSVPC